MQVPEGREDLEDVGDRLGHRQGRAVLVAVAGAQLTQRLAAHVLHDDVPGAVVLDEVVDLDDVGVLDLGQESPFGDRRGHGRLVPGVEQALEDDPAVRDVLVLGQVDPPQPAVGDAPGDQVLAGHEVARPQLRREGVRLAAVRAEPSVRAGRAPRLRPTGVSQRAQNRLRSGTSGSTRRTDCGSR